MLMILVGIINAFLLISGVAMIIGIIAVIIIEWENRDIPTKGRGPG